MSLTLLQRNKNRLIIEHAELYFELKSRPENKLSQAEKLKLKISGEVVLKSGIKSASDIEIIRRTYNENEKKSAALNDKFKALEQRVMEYTDIMEHYKKISQKDYISRLVEEKKRKAGKLE